MRVPTLLTRLHGPVTVTRVLVAGQERAVRRARSERGQALVEVVGAVPVLVLVGLVLLQALAVGYAAVLAGTAAHAGALALAAGGDARAGARESLPGLVARAGSRGGVGRAGAGAAEAARCARLRRGHVELESEAEVDRS